MLSYALIMCAAAILDDACPFDPCFYRCGFCEDDEGGDTCAECWRAYLLWLECALDVYKPLRPVSCRPDAATRHRVAAGKIPR